MTTFTSTHRIMAEVSISQLLEAFIKRNHREDAFKEHSAANLFLQLVPESQRALIQKVWCEKGKLFVKTNNASLRFELRNQRSSYLEQINQKLEKEVVKEIVLR